MSTVQYFNDQFEQLNVSKERNGLDAKRINAFDTFNKLGIPTSRHEEWKYTRIAGLFNKDFNFSVDPASVKVTAKDVAAFRLPGHQEANELFFINGLFSSELSHIRSANLVISSLEEASANQYKDIVAAHLGHSANYQHDGINALNTAFMKEGIFLHVAKGQTADHPVYIYNVSDTRSSNIFSQPRTLVHVDVNAKLQLVETFVSIGSQHSFTNQVMEIVAELDAMVEYYKIQDDEVTASQVSTTHFRQAGKSYIHAVTISLNGDIVRNNTNVVMEAANSEAHLYGLYFLHGKTHVDNHTVVDNVKPNCLSNEYYKGIMADHSSGVFNGKIFVQKDAQKTNAYQSNKNILLSEDASVNTKPQLEIFADDVKCSHGCTVGQLDEEGLFYLRSRGISEKVAMSLLLHGYTMDVLEKIKSPAIRSYIDQVISERLQYDLA